MNQTPKIPYFYLIHIFNLLLALIPLSSPMAAVKEEEAQKLENDVFYAYQQELHQAGLELSFDNRFSDSRANGYSTKIGNKLMVVLFGGLANSPDMTPDAFLLTICGQLGRFFGGAPVNQQDNRSSVGQSDYYASAKCLKRVILFQKNLQEIFNLDPLIKERCQRANSDQTNEILCQRVALAGLQLSKFLAQINNVKAPQLSTPDRLIVDSQSFNYPNPQCRLDTFFAGALCNEDPFSPVDNSNPNIGYCTRENGHHFGLRPLCWFRP